MSKNLTHLHVHTEYSMLDGYNRIDNMLKRLNILNMDAVAITDHGTLSGVYQFNKKCKENGIKPIIGCEMYYTEDTAQLTSDKKERDKVAMEKAEKAGIDLKELKKLKSKELNALLKEYTYDTRGYHLVLLAKNQNGWKNLCNLVSESFEIGLFNGRPHCDLNLLKKYHKDLICTTACMGSYLNSLILKNNLQEAEKHLMLLKDIFKENLFVEIQPLDNDKQEKINKELILLSEKYNIKLIATNDVHYTNKEDHFEHDVLLCIGTKKKLSDKDRMRYDNEFWIRSYDEMYEAFKRRLQDEKYDKYIYEALENTNTIKNMVDGNIEMKSPTPLLPEVDVPKEYKTDDMYFNQLCWKNLYKYLKKNNLEDKKEIYEKRLLHETNIIRKKGFSSYCLTVLDAINKGVFGPGRGSGAGSLALFLLGIIKGTDPIEYGLLFSRFLTMDRTSPPDIDSDISKVGRQDLISYLNNKYGLENTSQVGTLSLIGVKSGIKDIARVFGISPTESNNITKIISEIYEDPDISFKVLDALEETDIEKYKKFKELENKYNEIFTIARHFEGVPRNMGIHAGGVLITPCRINDYFPTKIVDGKKVTMWDKDTVEEANGVKFDYLGLKNISVIEYTLELIKETTGEVISIIDLYNNKSIRNDEAVFNMLCNLETETVFQMESNLFKSLIDKIQPRDMKELIAITAMARPGPLQAGMDKTYINRKNGVEEIIYPVHGIESILGETYGTILYQEQIMMLSQKIAGFNDNQADTYLRKGVSKKKKKLIELCKEWFIYGKPEHDQYGDPILGGINNGYNEKELLVLWNDIEKNSSYLFNKSHATSYSLLTVITAYLKCYFPLEYYASVLSFEEDENKKNTYISMIKKQGINIKVPSLNKIKKHFTVDTNTNTIYYGLGSIKSIGEKTIEPILNNCPYNSIEDIANAPKSIINKKAAEGLILSGALDEHIDSIYDRKLLLNKFFELRKDKENISKDTALIRSDIIKYETHYLGASLSITPWFEEYKNGDSVNDIELIIDQVNERYDKKGKLMAFVETHDVAQEYDKIDLIVFASKYIKNIDVFDKKFGDKILVSGKKDNNKIIINTAQKIS